MAKRGMTAAKAALYEEYNKLNSMLNEAYGIYEDSCWMETVAVIPTYSTHPSKEKLENAILRGKEMIANVRNYPASEKQIKLLMKKSNDECFPELKEHQSEIPLLNKRQASQLIKGAIGIEQCVYSRYSTFAALEDEENNWNSTVDFIFSHLTKNITD